MRAYEHIWILGDLFLKNYLADYIEADNMENRESNDIKTHYDVAMYYEHPTLQVGTENVLIRLRDTLIQAINSEVLLPKAIIFVLDDDLLDAIDHYDFGITIALGKIMEWITNQIHKIIVCYKDKLPSRARKYKFPSIIWVNIPKHNVYGHYNDFKQKCNIAVSKATNNFKEMSTISLKGWNDCDLTYFEAGQISKTGLTMYWHGINKSFRDWDKSQMRSTFSYGNHSSPPERIDNFQTSSRHTVNDKYHWHGSNTNYARQRPQLKYETNFSWRSTSKTHR